MHSPAACARDIVDCVATVVVSDFRREPVVRRWRAAGEKYLQRRLHPTSHTVSNACRWQHMRMHAWVENRAISLRIFACARPWASLVDKKFSAGGQAARTAASRRALLRRCSGQQRACLHRKKKTAQKKCFFENVVAPLHAKGSGARHRTASLDTLDGTRRDEALKKKCKRVLTVKKSVIRFRPADVAAKESEQNRHQADTLVP
ncbi:hypothetical protein [Xanthomonas arboricola]|uniref:hypothetical protein n=1 Tax=Xanthomonas arboricola TaxID=56448 RepID=UPI0015593BCA|nr:hypothetical protein [Xanthomonas arboricola]